LDRCALFVDAGYVLAEGAQAVHGTRNRDSVSWDYAGLLKLLGGLSRDRTGLPLLRCYWYDTVTEGSRAAEHDTLGDVPGVKLRLSKPSRKEGVEAEIRKDLTALARNRAVSDAVIVSAEEDLAPVIAEVQDLGIRAILLHISADGNWVISRPLRQECDDIIEISAGHLRPYIDLIQGAEPAGSDAQLAVAGYRELPAGAAIGNSLHAMEQPAIAAPVPQLYPSPVAADFDRLAQVQLASAGRDPQAGLPAQEADRFGPAAASNESLATAPGQRRGDDQAPVLPAQYQGPDQGRGQPGVSPTQSPYGQNGFAADGPVHGNGQVRAANAGLGLPQQDGGTGPHGMPSPNVAPPGGLNQGGLPPNGAPQHGGPQNGMPQGGPHGGSQNGLAQNGLAQNGLTQSGVPQNGMPQGGLAHGGPQNGLLPNGMPPGGVPHGGPQNGMPQNGLAQNGMPPSGGPPVGGPQHGSSQNGLPAAGFGAGQQPGASQGQPGMPSTMHQLPGLSAQLGQPGAQGQGQGQHGPGSQAGHGQHEGAPSGPQHGQGQGQHSHGPQHAQGLPPGQLAGQSGHPGAGIPGPQGFQPAGGMGQPGQGMQPAAQGMPPGGQGQPRQGPGLPPGGQQNGIAPLEQRAPMQRQNPAGNGMQYPQDRAPQFGGPPPAGQFGGPPANPYGSPPYGPPQPVQVPPPVTISVGEAVQSAHAEGFGFGEAVARDAPALWLEAVLARKPRMPSDLEARLLQGSALPIDSLLHDEVRHALRRGFWDALERSRH
jgi:hypothetical protein